MARINSVGLDELANAFRTTAQTSRETKMEMLKKAGEKVAEVTKRSAELHGLRDSGQLIQSIRSGPIIIHSDSASVEVWPQGNRKGGERNAVVGFVQEYGRSYGRRKRPGQKFFEDAAEQSAEDVVTTMAEIWRRNEKHE